MRIFFLVCVQPPLALVQPSARVLFLQFDDGKKKYAPAKIMVGAKKTVPSGHRPAHVGGGKNYPWRDLNPQSPDS